MPTPITIAIGEVNLPAQLNDSATGAAVAALLPVKIAMNRWGDEYYGSLPRPLGIGLAEDAREDMVVGELAYWPPGNALCIFFGPTPASDDDQPKAASPVNPVGTIIGDATALKKLGRSVTVELRRR